MLPELESSALLLLCRHQNGRIITPETTQDKKDLQALSSLDYVTLYLRGASATIAPKGIKRLQLEAEAIIRGMLNKKLDPDRIAFALNNVGFKTRRGKSWSQMDIISSVGMDHA